MTAILRVGDLEINRILKTVSRNDNVIDLTAKEFALLDLVRNKGRIVSRYEIIENVWDINFDCHQCSGSVHKLFLKRLIATLIPNLSIPNKEWVTTSKSKASQSNEH